MKPARIAAATVFAALLLIALALGYHAATGGASAQSVEQIAFVSLRGVPADLTPLYEVYLMDTDGSNAVRLTTNSAYEQSPYWSPDGTKLAFVSERNGDREVYVMNADGTGQTNLTNATSSWDSDPAWSPDGTKIAFASDRGGNFDIYVMNSDGSGQVLLASDPGFDRGPHWSPDGTKIAFVTYRDGNGEI